MTQAGTFQPAKLVPNTNTSSNPGVAVFNDHLYVFHQGNNNDGTLWYNRLDKQGNWAGDKRVPNTEMSSGPSVVLFNNSLYIFHQGGRNDRTLWYNVLDSNGNLAGDKIVPNTNMSGSPSAVVFQNKLYVFHQGNINDGTLWYNTLGPDGKTWQGDTKVQGTRPLTKDTGPSAQVYALQGSGTDYLYVYYQSGGAPYFNVLDAAGKWQGEHSVPNVGISASPCAATFGPGVALS
jgi:hypothetical protein